MLDDGGDDEGGIIFSKKGTRRTRNRGELDVISRCPLSLARHKEDGPLSRCPLSLARRCFPLVNPVLFSSPEVPEEEMVKRVLERAEKAKAAGEETRGDDDEATIKKRLETNKNECEPIVKQYENEKDVFFKIDGEKPANAVWRDVQGKIRVGRFLSGDRGIFPVNPAAGLLVERTTSQMISHQFSQNSTIHDFGKIMQIFVLQLFEKAIRTAYPPPAKASNKEPTERKLPDMTKIGDIDPNTTRYSFVCKVLKQEPHHKVGRGGTKHHMGRMRRTTCNMYLIRKNCPPPS